MAATTRTQSPFEVLGLDSRQPITNEMVSRAFRRLLVEYYPGGGGRQADPAKYDAIMAARSALDSPDKRQEERAKLVQPQAAPTPGTGGPLTWTTVAPGEVVDDSEGFTIRGLLRDSWNEILDRRMLNGSSWMPFPHLWEDAVTKILVIMFVTIVAGIAITILAVWWTQIFDLIHAIEWIIHALFIILREIFIILQDIANAFGRHPATK